LAAQDGIQRGTIKKIDADKGTVTITVGDKDHDYTVAEDTRIMDVAGKPVKERLKSKDLKEGAAVFFKPATKDGKAVLVGLKLAGNNQGNQPPPSIPKVDTSKLIPLIESGEKEYNGFKGGLYPNGKSVRPEAHEAAGVALAEKVQPLDAGGKPNPNGKVVLLSVGMSNTTQEFSLFKQLADRDKDKDSRLVIVDGAQGGQTAALIQNSKVKFWDVVDQRLQDAGVTRAQVQAAWIKEADARPTLPFPKHAQILQEELTRIVQGMHERFPNLKLVYLSSRTYGGYARTPLNPEPYAYESGFAVKWLIERQIQGDAALNYDLAKGAVKAPWLSWGPYLWANGPTKLASGLFYEESDFSNDGTHPSPSGRRKVAEQLLRFFKSDRTTKGWFGKS
jgi:hypothetical protein